MSTSLTKKDNTLDHLLGFRTVSIKELGAEDKKVLLDTVAKDLNDSELSFFLNVSLAQELNPFTKEVWAIKMGGRLVIMTARDGYLKIAKRDPNFSTIQSAEVREGDSFTIDPVSGQVEHRFTAKRGAILGAYAIITRKDGKKVSKYVTYSEYQGSSEPWRKYPSAMICKCAETALCKQFANISGIDAEELMPRDAIEATATPSNQDEAKHIKNIILEDIANCTTLEEFETMKRELPPLIGKLFEEEKQEVFAAAKKKREELTALNIQDAEVVETPKKRGRKPKSEIEKLDPEFQQSEITKEDVNDVFTEEEKDEIRKEEADQSSLF